MPRPLGPRQVRPKVRKAATEAQTEVWARIRRPKQRFSRPNLSVLDLSSARIASPKSGSRKGAPLPCLSAPAPQASTLHTNSVRYSVSHNGAVRCNEGVGHIEAVRCNRVQAAANQSPQKHEPRKRDSVFHILNSSILAAVIVAIIPGLAAAEPASLPDIRSIATDLTIPAISDGDPAPGKRGIPERREAREWLRRVLKERPGTYSVRGRVVDVNRKPLGGVRIESGAHYWTFTGRDNSYSLKGLLASKRTVRASGLGLQFEPDERVIELRADVADMDFAGARGQ